LRLGQVPTVDVLADDESAWINPAEDESLARGPQVDQLHGGQPIAAIEQKPFDAVSATGRPQLDRFMEAVLLDILTESAKLILRQHGENISRWMHLVNIAPTHFTLPDGLNSRSWRNLARSRGSTRNLDFRWPWATRYARRRPSWIASSTMVRRYLVLPFLR